MYRRRSEIVDAIQFREGDLVLPGGREALERWFSSQNDPTKELVVDTLTHPDRGILWVGNNRVKDGSFLVARPEAEPYGGMATAIVEVWPRERFEREWEPQGTAEQAESLAKAVQAACECGGAGGPGRCCAACEVFYRLHGKRPHAFVVRALDVATGEVTKDEVEAWSLRDAWLTVLESGTELIPPVALGPNGEWLTIQELEEVSIEAQEQAGGRPSAEK